MKLLTKEYNCPRCLEGIDMIPILEINDKVKLLHEEIEYYINHGFNKKRESHLSHQERFQGEHILHSLVRYCFPIFSQSKPDLMVDSMVQRSMSAHECEETVQKSDSREQTDTSCNCGDKEKCLECHQRDCDFCKGCGYGDSQSLTDVKMINDNVDLPSLPIVKSLASMSEGEMKYILVCYECGSQFLNNIDYLDGGIVWESRCNCNSGIKVISNKEEHN